MRILIGVTGSVATIKLSELIAKLKAKNPGVDIRVVTTAHARWFLGDQSIDAELMYTDDREWSAWTKKGDPVLHIDLRNWADLFLIAPLSANSLAKIANGICDNLLTCIFRAWDKKKPIIVCPAMNTYMWENPFTERHLSVIQEVYPVKVVMPKSDHLLACGDRGPGAMASVETIADVILENLSPRVS